MVIKNILFIIKPFASAILAILLVNSFNLFEHISFMPENIQFETGLTVYVAIFEYISTIFIDVIVNKFFTEINCIFYNDKGEKDITSTPGIYFNDETGVCQVKLNIDAKGNSARLSNTNVKISFPDWVDIQPAQKNSIMSVDNHDCIVHIEKLLPRKSNQKEKLSTDIRLALIKIPIDEERSINIQTELVSTKGILNKLTCKYSSNSFRLINR